MEKSAISEKTETGTSSENENQDERLASAIRKMFKELEPSVSNKCRIYKVPYQLRTLNPEAYTPHVISIGPYHHNNENCRTMEKHKVRYFQSFMERVDTKGLKMENLVSTIREMENEIRSCYVETVQLKSDDFVKMIMLDASFFLELILRDNREIDNPMRMEGWVIPMVRRDLLLLENQLPFFVIEKLYLLALPYLPNPTPLIQLTFHFFEDLNIHKKSHTNEEIQHFTDLLRFFQLPPSNNLPKRVRKASYPKYSLTQLQEAGVKFKVGSSRRIWDLSFENKVLEIPLLLFDDDTEALVRNIMALEQCDYPRETYVTDFYSILDNLINTNEDVKLLINKGILVNWLGDNNAVISMISNLNRGICFGIMNSEFSHISEALNHYYEEPWHRWKAILRQQYSIMAILALVLTLIQTVLSILQVVQ